jgi:Flp pilus assembly protein TadG
MQTVRNEKGSVLVFMTLMIVVLLVMVGIGLDTGQLTYTRNMGQSAVDAAALAAVSGLASGGTIAQRDAQVKARALGFNSTNNYTNSTADALKDSDVSYVHYNFTTNMVESNTSTIQLDTNGVRVSRETARGITTPMFLTPLMNLLGIATAGTQTVNVSAVSTITSKPAIPIAMWTNQCGSGPPYSVQPGVHIEMQHPDQNAAGENSCWTTFFDCSSGAPDIKAGFTVAATCSGNSIDGNITIGSLICQNKGQVNTVMGAAKDFFLDTPSNVGKWWIIPVIAGGGNCDPKNPTAITDFAKIQVTDVVKNGSPKYITANVQCGISLDSLDESLCYSHRLVREKGQNY